MIQHNTHTEEAFDQIRNLLKKAIDELKFGNPHTIETDTYRYDNDLIHEAEAALTAAKEVQAQVEPTVDYRAMYIKVRDELAGLQQATPQAQRLSDAEIDAGWTEHDKAYVFVSSKWSFEAGVKFAETAFCSKNGIHLGD